MKLAKRKTLITTILIVSALLVLFAYSCTSYINNISSNLSEEAKSSIMEATMQGSATIRNRVNGSLNVVSTIAKTLAQGDYTSKKDVSNYLNLFIDQDKYIRFEVHDLEGNTLIADGKQYSIQTNQIPMQNKGRENYVSTPFTDSISQQKVISFNSPIIVDDKVVGIVSGIKYLESLYDTFNLTFYNGNGYSYIVDSKGNLILPSKNPKSDQSFTNIFNKMKDYSNNTEALDQFSSDLSNNQQGVARFNVNNVAKLIGYVPIEGVNDWYLLSVVPQSIVAMHQTEILESTLSLCLIIFFILTIIFTYIIRTNRKTRKQIETLAFQDPVTGADNLNKFKILATEQLNKKTSEAYALVQFDIDKLKYINDIFGYEEGNRALRYIANALKENLAGNEPFARMANDYFVALLVYENDKKLLERLEDINQKICMLQKKSINHYTLKLACGIYRIKNRNIDIVSMIEHANFAHKTIKGNPQTSYAFYNDEIRNKIIQEKEIENDMVESLENKEFIFYLQPQYELKTTKIVGAEALARWNHPKKGLLQPGAFIPLFEKNNFILNLDLFIFEQVCIKLQEWIHQGYKPLPISVNMSRLHLHNEKLSQTLKAIIEKYDVPACFIELELTESAFFNNIDLLLSVMEKLRNIGFTISMDDFGSGYSSLNLLKELPVDTLKIDREFFKNTTHSLRGQKVVSGIISIAKELHIRVISEGVETIEQSEFLKRIDCDMAQGFFYARPMTIADFEKIAFNM